MFKYTEPALAFLVMAALPATAQDTQHQLRPEIDLYVNQGSRIRFVFQDALFYSDQPRLAQGYFAYYVDLALRPVFRQELRDDEDVFRRRYLSFRGGFQRSNSFLNGSRSSEDRIITELTARYPLSHGIVVVDRNRGDFRFINGQGFSTRYRNRLWVERDLKFKPIVFTPYAYDELYFDTRYNAWSVNRIVLGLQFPIERKMVVEPYYLWQRNMRSTPRHDQAVGLKLSFFF